MDQIIEKLSGSLDIFKKKSKRIPNVSKEIFKQNSERKTYSEKNPIVKVISKISSNPYEILDNSLDSVNCLKPLKYPDGTIGYHIIFSPSSILMQIPVTILSEKKCEILCLRHETFDDLRKEFFRLNGFPEDYKIIFRINSQEMNFVDRIEDFFPEKLRRRHDTHASVPIYISKK